MRCSYRRREMRMHDIYTTSSVMTSILRKMADRRRRRHSENDSGDEFSQNTVNSSLPERPSECESEGDHQEPELSEYESAVDSSREVEETEEETETEEEEGEEDEGTAEEDSGDDVVVEGTVDEERQSGDGEEQPNENLDDDEDKKNPAYIPRKGAFFEHDMRMDPDADERNLPGGGRGRGKGRLWKDETKWLHDRYMAEEQAPKSRQELVALYGYDILTADKPPDTPPRMNSRGRGPRGRKFQDFIPADNERSQSYKYTSEWVKGQNQGHFDKDNAPDYEEDYPPPRRQNEGRGRGGRGGRGSRGQGQRRTYSDLQEERSQPNRPYSNRDRGFDNRNENDGYYQDDYRGNRNAGYRGGRSRTYSDGSDGAQDSYSRGYQGNRGRNRENYGGNRENFGGNRDNFRRDGNRDRDNFGGNRDNYSDNRGDFSRNRDNYGGNRDNVKGRRDNFRGRGDNYQGNRDYNKGPRFERSDSNQDSGYQQNRNTNYRDDRHNRRFNENQSRDIDRYEGSQEARADLRDRRSGGNERGSREVRHEEKEGYSETRETRPTGHSEQREAVEKARQYLRPESSEVRSHVYDKMKSYYTLSPVTDDEKLLNEGLEFENSANSLHLRDGVQDLNITVSDMGNRKTFAKEKRPADEGDARKPQHVRHQPTLPPRLQQQQQQQQQERKKQQQQQAQAQAQAAAQTAQATQAPVPSPAPIAERIDQTQRGSSKRYSSQRQRNVPEGPGYQEGSGVQSPGAQGPMVPPQAQGPPPPSQGAVQVPKLSEPAFFNPAFSPPKPGVSLPPPMIRPPPNFPPPVSGVMPASTGQSGPRVPSPQRIVAPQIIAGAPPGPPPVFATPNTLEPVSVAAPGPPVSMIPPPPSQLPLGVMYAVPPPPAPFQLSGGVPGVPQFPAPQTVPPSGVVPQIPQSQPQEAVRGGTTYYSSENQPRSKSTGVTYYPPEAQKKNRVTVRRPKVAIPIVNPEDMKKDGKLGSSEGLDEPFSASPSTTDPPMDSVEIAASDMGKLKIDSQSPVSPGETNVDDLGSSVVPPGESSVTENFEDTTYSVAINQNVNIEQSELEQAESGGNYGQVEGGDANEFYDAEENPVQNNNESNKVKDQTDASHEPSKEIKVESVTESRIENESRDESENKIDSESRVKNESGFESETRLRNEDNSLAEIEQNEQVTDQDEVVRTQTVSVSDKLIPEFKLEFKVNTEGSETSHKEQEKVVKTEVEADS